MLVENSKIVVPLQRQVGGPGESCIKRKCDGEYILCLVGGGNPRR